MEKLVDPMMTTPTEPSSTEEFENAERGQVPDPANEGQTIEGIILVTRVQNIDSSLLTSRMDKYMLLYRACLVETRH